jgi:signal transduction histidine kinase
VGGGTPEEERHRMGISIRLRTIIALNVFVIGLSIVLGWIAQDVAGQVVEERFVKEMVGSASGFLKGKSFPRSDPMMGYLRELFNAEWIASEDKASNIVGSSLPGPATEEFRRQAPGLGRLGVVYLGGQRYRFDSADVDAADARTARPTRGRLYMLLPDAQFQEARQRAQARVARVIWPAAGVATLLAALLSFSVTHPIRRLASEMDRLTDTHDTSSQARRAIGRGPKEISRLAKSFYELLDRLGAARQQVAESERLATLGKICLSVAHELRNPLSGIKMNVRVLRDRAGLSDDPGIEAILREIDRMGLYLNELMNLSPGDDRLSRTPSTAPTKLSDLAESVLTILSGRCRHARVAVERDFPSEEPSVIADANQIRQVMMNLMVNAVEAMPGGGTMTVRIQPTPAVLRFSIADTGKGVQVRDENLFEAFSSGKPNGVGLGLYLSKQIVDRHGGRIGYDSSAAGAVFWFELPIQTADAGAEAKPAEEAGSEPSR